MDRQLDEAFTVLGIPAGSDRGRRLQACARDSVGTTSRRRPRPWMCP